MAYLVSVSPTQDPLRVDADHYNLVNGPLGEQNVVFYEKFPQKGPMKIVGIFKSWQYFVKADKVR